MQKVNLELTLYVLVTTLFKEKSIYDSTIIHDPVGVVLSLDAVFKGQ